MSKEPLAYTRRWLYVLPAQEAGAQPIPRMRDDEEDLAARRLSAAKAITAKAVPELKPKTKDVNRDKQNSNKGGDQLIGQQLN